MGAGLESLDSHFTTPLDVVAVWRHGSVRVRLRVRVNQHVGSGHVPWLQVGVRQGKGLHGARPARRRLSCRLTGETPALLCGFH